MKTCPCCGQLLQGEVEKAVLSLRRPLSKGQERILMYLARYCGRWVYTDALIDAVYWDDPEGGPDNARNVMSVQVWWLRKKLSGTGLEIEGIGGRGGRRRLVDLRPVMEAAA